MSRAVTCICKACGKAEVTSGGNQHFKCKKCKSGKSDGEILQEKAGRQVAKAVRKGLLPPATSKRCVDCKVRAEVYDHREYAKPLDVVPVCRRCNILRGPAIDSHVQTNRFIKAANARRHSARSAVKKTVCGEVTEFFDDPKNHGF